MVRPCLKKKKKKHQAQWLKPVILAREADIGRIMLKASPSIKSSQDPISTSSWV
jgi:hypothetical protein